MERIRARERLLDMDSNQYPNLQDKERRKKHKDVYKKAFPESFENRSIKTTDLELI